MAISRAQLMKELLPGLNALFGMEYKNLTTWSLLQMNALRSQ